MLKADVIALLVDIIQIRFQMFNFVVLDIVEP